MYLFKAFVLMQKKFAMVFLGCHRVGECNVNICELTSKLEQRTEKLKALETKLHSTEERIRKLRRNFCQFIFFHINTRAPTSLISVHDQKCLATE